MARSREVKKLTCWFLIFLTICCFHFFDGEAILKQLYTHFVKKYNFEPKLSEILEKKFVYQVTKFQTFSKFETLYLLQIFSKNKYDLMKKIFELSAFK